MLSNYWKKGSRSNGTGGSNCVEVKKNEANHILVRNSKDPEWGPIVGFSVAEWIAFIESVKLGEFDI